MRIGLTLLTLAIGTVLGLVSYLLFAAELGTPTNEDFSNPRVPLAATWFVLSVAIVFIAALVYELLPERKRD